MKGIVLACGRGARLYPATYAISKHLLPIYDKPMIYYPLSVLMLSGIRDILVIAILRDIDRFRSLLGDGGQWGISISYSSQNEQCSLVEAIIIGEGFIGADSVSLILGDNIFYGHGFINKLQELSALQNGAVIFGYRVKESHGFSIIEFSEDETILSIKEKPKEPENNIAVTGLYFYDNHVVEIAKNIRASSRLICDLNNVNSYYLELGTLRVEILGRGYAWLDISTHDSLIEASHFVQTIERRQGYKLACLEEIAYRFGWISKNDLFALSKPLQKNGYGKYLLKIMEE